MLESKSGTLKCGNQHGFAQRTARRAKNFCGRQPRTSVAPASEACEKPHADPTPCSGKFDSICLSRGLGTRTPALVSEIAVSRRAAMLGGNRCDPGTASRCRSPAAVRGLTAGSPRLTGLRGLAFAKSRESTACRRRSTCRTARGDADEEIELPAHRLGGQRISAVRARTDNGLGCDMGQRCLQDGCGVHR